MNFKILFNGKINQGIKIMGINNEIKFSNYYYY
jgi:hypothetical protein